MASNSDTRRSWREAGIPGIRYLDQGSRGQTKPTFSSTERRALSACNETRRCGTSAVPAHVTSYSQRERRHLAALPKSTSNYVVFDPGIIDILRKYGLAGATAAPLGALAAQDNYRP